MRPADTQATFPGAQTNIETPTVTQATAIGGIARVLIPSGRRNAQNSTTRPTTTLTKVWSSRAKGSVSLVTGKIPLLRIHTR